MGGHHFFVVWFIHLARHTRAKAIRNAARRSLRRIKVAMARVNPAQIASAFAQVLKAARVVGGRLGNCLFWAGVILDFVAGLSSSKRR